MKVLVWNAPWAVQGDLLFFKNCYLKHLLLQANLLRTQGFDVELVTNDYISEPNVRIESGIKIINLTAAEIHGLSQGIHLPMVNLYKNKDSDFVQKIKTFLTPKLSEHYDAILIWENPVPFLEEMYPDAVIVHQMPGAFSRSPFPATTTFDVDGLYRDGAIHKHSLEIIQDNNLHKSSTLELFREGIKDVYQKLPKLHEVELKKHNFEQLALVPLQVSNHYAFISDTPYASQIDFLHDVLAKSPENTGIVATQYVSPKIHDTVLNPQTYALLKASWPNLIYSPSFDKTQTISQHLLPQVSKVITCSSSVGMQAMLWSRNIEVMGNTFLSHYSDNYLTDLGVNAQVARDNLMTFLLERHQVMSTRLVHDGKFLSELLYALVAKKRANAKGIDKFVKFEEIDNEYPQHLVSAINATKISKDLRSASPALDAELIAVEKFERAIRNNEIESISFDLFDTLIARPVEVPADAYHFLEREALKISRGVTEDFARVRLNAEVETRARSTKGEITLDEIYEQIIEHYQIDPEIIGQIKKKELDLEVALVEKRELGYRLWNVAKASNRPITIISDMYLPYETILAMVEKTGYTGYKKLYVSSDYGVRKKEGGLYDYVIADQRIKPTKHLHVGDNKAADVDQSQARGMFAFRIPRAIDRMRANPHYAKIFNPRSGVGEKSRSVIAGLIANKFFDLPSGPLEQETLFMGSSYKLGYAGLGPVLSGFMVWLSRTAKAQGVSRLYFLSREGWVLKQAYDALTRHIPDAVPSYYLYCSRRAARVAALQTISDITSVACQPFEAGVSLRDLLKNRFGLSSTPEIEQIVFDNSGLTIDQPLSSDSAGRVAFSKVCVNLSSEILAHAQTEREAYQKYLQVSGIASESQPAIVDIGWKGNMQGSLGNLIGRPLQGYYYATLQGAERWEILGHKLSAYAGESLSVGHESALTSNRHICEFLTCKAAGSLVCFEFDYQGNLTPKFRTETEQSRRNILIEEIHRGAIDFSADLAARFKGVQDGVLIDPQLAERVFKTFLTSPIKADAKLLLGYAFEDAFGGVERKFVIAEDASLVSVWQKGSALFHTQPPKKPAAPAKTPAPQKPATPPAKPAVKPDAKAAAPAAKTEAPKEVKKPAKPANDASTQTKPANDDVKVPAVKKSSVEIGIQPRSRVDYYPGKMLKPFETVVIRCMVTNKKFDKYRRDRDAFFRDSKDRLAVRWYALTNPEANNL
ncbi:HAD family hydrolase [Pseudomonas sp. KCJK9058]|uniref:HAD family hydrolase n=1 Tax=Pseudomonas sp. KCJK9058 TaxID=3344563 RepID=UPI003905E05E